MRVGPRACICAGCAACVVAAWGFAGSTGLGEGAAFSWAQALPVRSSAATRLLIRVAFTLSISSQIHAFRQKSGWVRGGAAFHLQRYKTTSEKPSPGRTFPDRYLDHHLGCKDPSRGLKASVPWRGCPTRSAGKKPCVRAASADL